MFSRFVNTLLARKDGNPATLKAEGDAFLASGDFAAAAQRYRAAIALDAKMASAYVNFAFALKELGQDNEAIGAATQAVALDPLLADAHYLLASIAAARGALPEAENRYRAALAAAPAFEAACLELCMLLVRQGRADDAQRVAESGLSAAPDCVGLHLCLGNLAYAAHRFQDAIAHFRQGLFLAPDNQALLDNAGLAYLQAGQINDAIASLEASSALDPAACDTLCNLGEALVSAQRAQDALLRFDQVLLLEPDNVRALFGRANLLLSRKDYDTAEALYRRVVELEKTHFGAWFQLGYLCQVREQYVEAADFLEQALVLSPENTDARLNLGICLRHLKRYDEALDAFAIVRRSANKPAVACDETGNVYQELGNFAEAAQWHTQSIRHDPSRVESYNNLGLAYQLQHKLDEAEASFRQAIETDADFVAAHANLGTLLTWSKRDEEAMQCFDRALALDDQYHAAREKRAGINLLHGNFEAGWPDLESRWYSNEFLHKLPSTSPEWRGDADIAGKTVLLYGEQGYGDNLQFVRYAQLVARRGATVLLLVPKPLHALFASIPGIAQLLERQDELPAHDFIVPLMSLPLAFGTTVSTIPGETPYLHATPERAQYWRERLGSHTKPRIGLVWSGDPRKHLPRVHAIDRMRSLPFDLLKPLLEVPGVEFHSLQLGADALAQLQGCPNVIDHSAALTDFHETAALIDNLDLVISADTSVAHLAGAVGKPVWLLNRYNTCWRWLNDRSDSPWYPTMRVFRQPALGDWDTVIADVRNTLAEQTPAMSAMLQGKST